MKWSANLGFLWPELTLPDRIRAAARAGFSAVECHFPYEHEPEEIRGVLAEAGLRMLSINTALGQNGPDDFGVAALPGREEEAQRLIQQAVQYAAAIGARSVSVLAGRSEGASGAEDTYRANLTYAAGLAGAAGINILVEPISQRAVPGYHVSYVETAVETIEAVGAPNIGLMFDCFHTQIMQGDLATRLWTNLRHIAHVQIAAVPDRGEPDSGEVNYPWLLAELDSMGYEGWIGAEYQPRTTTDEGLGWRGAYAH